MFEIDENTRYSLRLIGRGSLILVSIALILALIGYFQRDNSAAKSENEFLFAEFVSAEEEIKTQLLNQKIVITGVIDSLDVQAGRVLVVLREENPSKTMYCYFPEMDNIDRIKRNTILREYLAVTTILGLN